MLDRYFVLDKKCITYYAAPGQGARGSIFIDTPTHKALAGLGFVKKGTIELTDILNMKKSEENNVLLLVLRSGRVHDLAGFDDSASRLDLGAFESCLQRLGVNWDAGMSAIYEVCKFALR